MKKRLQALLLALCLTLGTIGAGCGGRQDNNAAGTEKTASVEDSAMAKANAGELNIIDDKYRTYYEVFLYSFYDSDGDGIGDIQGLIDKLDYINISERMIYPGLDGVCRWITRRYSALGPQYNRIPDRE